MKLDSNHHSVFLMHYHLVLVVKYRRKVINDTISERLREIFENIAPNYNITVEEWNHDGGPHTCSLQRTPKHAAVQVHQCI